MTIDYLPQYEKEPKMFKITINPGVPNIKFGLFEKHSKFQLNLSYGFDKSADLLRKRQNHKEDFFKICVLLKKSEV